MFIRIYFNWRLKLLNIRKICIKNRPYSRWKSAIHITDIQWLLRCANHWASNGDEVHWEASPIAAAVSRKTRWRLFSRQRSQRRTSSASKPRRDPTFSRSCAPTSSSSPGLGRSGRARARWPARRVTWCWTRTCMRTWRTRWRTRSSRWFSWPTSRRRLRDSAARKNTWKLLTSSYILSKAASNLIFFAMTYLFILWAKLY